MRHTPSRASGLYKIHMRFADVNPLNRFGFYQRLRDPEWHFSAKGRESRKRLEEYRNKHAGEKAAIIGSGPSLLKTDLARLEGRKLFGMNRLYTGFAELGLTVDYYLAVNEYVMEYFGREIAALDIPFFVGWGGRKHVPFDDHVTYLYAQSGADFETELTKRVPVGGTVTFAAMQLAYFMGFSDVVLVGVDHRFELTKDESQSGPNAAMKRNGADVNHFSSNYFPAGITWQTPDLDQSSQAYRNALKAYVADGRIIRDATVDGALDVFPRHDEDLRLPVNAA